MKVERKKMILTAVMRVKPGKVKEVRDIFQSLMLVVEEEEGTIEYKVHSSTVIIRICRTHSGNSAVLLWGTAC
jgi:quinol monooxygenase YgiN